ncbi:MAG TPA: serine/threonine-protein kinase [Polyangiaceae bacterium]|nr:serine/threonine-protein kinase [Polyangiaceae bacterium]
MRTFARDEQSTPEHELVLDEELIQDEQSELREHRSPRMRAPAESSDEPPPRRLPVRTGDVLLGKYCVERVHRQGALGVTIEAEHLQLGQRVVLKLMLADPQVHPEAAARFLRGARFAVQLRNEHVARVIDVGTMESGAPYMVSEHLSGSDLRGVLRVREWLPVPEAVDYVLQACEALAEAHVLGFVHRNLKLSNLFLTRGRNGRPIIKVLDFCVSEGPLADAAISISTNGAIVSSLAYLSPEQIRDPSSVDRRADVWAMGAILHELLTGMPLYSESSAPGLFAAITADPATPVSHLRPEIPAELESVVLRSVEKEREDRFADVGDFARQLKPFASAEGRESVDRIVLLLERRAYQSRSTRPPPLPGGTAQRSIVRVSAAPEQTETRSLRHRAIEIAAVGLGVMGLSVGVGAVITVRNLQSVLASRAAVEHNVVASLSPALTAPQAVEQAAASSAPPAPVAVPQPAKALPSKPKPPLLASAPPAPAAATHAATPDAEANVLADAKPTHAAPAPAHGLFDDAN